METDKHPLDWVNGRSLVTSARTISVVFRGKSPWRVNGRKARKLMSIFFTFSRLGCEEEMN